MNKIRILIANPAGNITIFVLDHFEPSQYQSIASQLLAMTELKGEQDVYKRQPSRRPSRVCKKKVMCLSNMANAPK